MTVPAANLDEALVFYSDKIKAGEFAAQLTALLGLKKARSAKRAENKAFKAAKPDTSAIAYRLQWPALVAGLSACLCRTRTRLEDIMALKDFFDSVGDKLEDAFNAKPRDPSKARQKLLKGLENAREQHGGGRTRVPNRWWTISNDVVAFTPKYKNMPLVINGKTTNFIPTDRFGEFLDEFKAEIEAGDFDAMLEAIDNGSGNAGSSVAMDISPRKRAPMSEQAKANIRAGRARAKAAREAAGNA